MAAAARGLEPVVTHDVRAVPGRGIRGNADGQPMAAGNSALMRDLGWPLAPALGERARSLEASGHSLIYVGWGGQGPWRAVARRHAASRSAFDDRGTAQPRAACRAPDRRSRARGAAGCRHRSGSRTCKRACRRKRSGLRSTGTGSATRWWRWSATASTMGRSWPTPMSVSPSAPPPTSRARPRLWCCPGRPVDAALGHHRGPHGAANHPHQPHLGVRLQPRRPDACRARDPAAGAGGRGHGEFEPSARRQFPAAVAAARSCPVGDPGARRRARSRTASVAVSAFR